MKTGLQKTLALFSLLIVLTVSGTAIFYAKANVWPTLKKNYFAADKLPGFVPKGSQIKKAILGFDNFVSDLYWLRTVQFAGANAVNMNFESLYEYLDLITDLDPHFAWPYEYGSYLLPLDNRTDKAVELLEKGMKNMPEKWEFVWRLAFIEYYYLEDFPRAIELYNKCSGMNGCLAGAKKTAEKLAFTADKYEVALTEWKRMYEDEKLAPEERELAKLNFIETDRLIVLNKFVKKYAEARGEMPDDLQEIMDSFPELDKEVFESPIEGHYFTYNRIRKIVDVVIK